MKFKKGDIMYKYNTSKATGQHIHNKNKRLLTNKNFITIIGIIILLVLLFLLTGCNKQVFDKSYTFNKIVCNYDGDKFELDIISWTDYDGEQIQIRSKDGNTYLLSANKCYMKGE